MTMGIKEKDRAKNMFVLGFLYWMYNRDMDNYHWFYKRKIWKETRDIESNVKALQAGYNYGDTTETFTTRYYSCQSQNGSRHLPVSYGQPGIILWFDCSIAKKAAYIYF